MVNLLSRLTNYYKEVIEYSDLNEVSILEDPTGRYPHGGYIIKQPELLLHQSLSIMYAMVL